LYRQKSSKTISLFLVQITHLWEYLSRGAFKKMARSKKNKIAKHTKKDSWILNKQGVNG